MYKFPYHIQMKYMKIFVFFFLSERGVSLNNNTDKHDISSRNIYLKRIERERERRGIEREDIYIV